jgi:hypothetical protein
MFLFSPRYLFPIPGLSLMLFGLIFGAALMRGPVMIGRAGFDIASLVYAGASVVSGFASGPVCVVGAVLWDPQGIPARSAGLNLWDRSAVFGGLRFALDRDAFPAG